MKAYSGTVKFNCMIDGGEEEIVLEVEASGSYSPGTRSDPEEFETNFIYIRDRFGNDWTNALSVREEKHISRLVHERLQNNG